MTGGEKREGGGKGSDGRGMEQDRHIIFASDDCREIHGTGVGEDGGKEEDSKGRRMEQDRHINFWEEREMKGVAGAGCGREGGEENEGEGRREVMRKEYERL